MAQKTTFLPFEWVGQSLPPPPTITMRKACVCGETIGKITLKGGQNCVYCCNCGKYQYNAPETETGQREAFGADLPVTTHSQLCISHNPPFDLIERPDVNRRGWIRSECRVCGKFIGYRPQGDE
jgi:hypothetical protein